MQQTKTDFLNLFSSLFTKNNIDAAIVTSPQNRQYISGFCVQQGTVLITPQQIYYLVDFRFYEDAQKKATGCKVVLIDNLGVSLCELLKKHKIKILEFEQNDLTVLRKEYFEKEFSLAGTQILCSGALDKFLEELRITKSEQEVQKIQESQRLTEHSLKTALQSFAPGITEKELALKIEFNMRKNGAQGVAFDLIVISSQNTSMPHGEPSNKPIQNGDLLLIDIGACLDGYNSDMTRTFAVGSVTDEQKQIYNIVLSAQLKGLQAIKAGVSCADIDKIVRDEITQNGYGECFGHGTGHGVGLNVHESPRLSPRSSTVLKPNMIITIEPGIYLSGKFGVRIEDIVCVTPDGCKNFNTISKELIIL
jgi:Xaa-Pro aminopeptidase